MKEYFIKLQVERDIPIDRFGKRLRVQAIELFHSKELATLAVDGVMHYGLEMRGDSQTSVRTSIVPEGLRDQKAAEDREEKEMVREVVTALVEEIEKKESL